MFDLGVSHGICSYFVVCCDVFMVSLLCCCLFNLFTVVVGFCFFILLCFVALLFGVVNKLMYQVSFLSVLDMLLLLFLV